MGILERLGGLIRREQKPQDPFNQLIKIAEGKARFPKTDPIAEEELERYKNLNDPRIIDQLRAIRLLGESGRPEALNFLTRIYTNESYCIDYMYRTADVYEYPKVKGPLRDALKWEDSNWQGEEKHNHCEPHRTMRVAISSLKKQLGSS